MLLGWTLFHILLLIIFVILAVIHYGLGFSVLEIISHCTEVVKVEFFENWSHMHLCFRWRRHRLLPRITHFQIEKYNFSFIIRFLIWRFFIFILNWLPSWRCPIPTRFRFGCQNYKVKFKRHFFSWLQVSIRFYFVATLRE